MLTTKQIEKASKLALKNLRPLTEVEKGAMIRANKAKKSKLRGKVKSIEEARKKRK